MYNSWFALLLLTLVVFASADITRRVGVEVARISKDKKVQRDMRRLRKSAQPWVTIIVYGSSTDADEKKTVRAIRRSRYSSYDIVRVGSRAKTFQTAYRKSRRGKIVVCLPVGLEIDAGFIKRAVAVRNNRNEWRVAIVQPLRRVEGLIGVAHSLGDIIWGRQACVEACTPAILRKKKLTHVRFSDSPYGLQFLPLAIAGMCIVGVALEGWSALWYIWLLVSIYLLLLVWIGRGIPRSMRMGLSFSVPSALFLLPVTTIVQTAFQQSTRK